MRGANITLLILELLFSLKAAFANGVRPCRWSWRHPICSISCKVGVGKCAGSLRHPPSPINAGPPTEWRMTRLYDDGFLSYFGEWAFPLTSGGETVRTSERIECDGVWLRWTSGAADPEPHNSPRRQIVASLNGHVETSAATGERLVFGPGDALLAEDLTGVGHSSQSLDGMDRWSILIALREPGVQGILDGLLVRPTPRECALLLLLAAFLLRPRALKRRVRWALSVEEQQHDGAPFLDLNEQYGEASSPGSPGSPNQAMLERRVAAILLEAEATAAEIVARAVAMAGGQDPATGPLRQAHLLSASSLEVFHPPLPLVRSASAMSSASALLDS